MVIRCGQGAWTALCRGEPFGGTGNREGGGAARLGGGSLRKGNRRSVDSFVERGKEAVPDAMRRVAEKWLLRLWVPPDRLVWELYSGAYQGKTTVGSEWNRTDRLGLSASPDEFLDYLNRELIRPVVEEYRPALTLEIGSGGGRITDLLVAACPRVIASDTSRGMMRIIRKRYMNRSHVEYLQLNGRDLRPLSDSSVDLVFSYDVFVHLNPWDIFNYLREIRRVLRPGGVAVIHHANTFSKFGWKQFTETELPVQLGTHKLPQNFTPMTPEFFASFAERAGMKVVGCNVTVVPRDAVSTLARPTTA